TVERRSPLLSFFLSPQDEGAHVVLAADLLEVRRPIVTLGAPAQLQLAAVEAVDAQDGLLLAPLIDVEVDCFGRFLRVELEGYRLFRFAGGLQDLQLVAGDADESAVEVGAVPHLG